MKLEVIERLEQANVFVSIRSVQALQHTLPCRVAAMFSSVRPHCVETRVNSSAPGSMYDCPVLDICERANHDGVQVSTQHAAIPDAHLCSIKQLSSSPFLARHFKHTV